MSDHIQSLFGMTGKVAIVTGSSKGIGKAIVENYAKLSAKVVVSSRKEEACEDVAEGIRRDGGEAISIPCNISNEDDLSRLVDTTLEEVGSDRYPGLQRRC